MTDEARAVPRIPLAAAVAIPLYLVIMAWLYTPALKLMVAWWENEDFNYCYLVPFVVLYLLWDKRKAFLSMPSQPSWWGLPVVALGLAMYWVGELGGEFLTLQLSSWMVLVGLLWLHLGWRKLKVIGFPIVLMLAMFPLPRFLHTQATLKLQLISSQIGVEIIRLMGMTAFREGNVIDVGFTKLQVVEACSGLRYIFPLLVLALILAYFFRAQLWKRALLLAAALPLSIVVNSGRIGFAAVSHRLWGAEVAEGFLHDFSGWAIFMVSLALLLAFQWVLSRIPPRVPRLVQPADSTPPASDEPPEKDEPGGPPTVASPGFSIRSLLRPAAALVLMVATVIFSSQVEFRERVPIRKPLEGFPLQVSDWKGKHNQLDDQFVRALKFSDHTLIDYRNPAGNAVNLYVAYYETQRKGESIHSPETCLAGSGWVFKEKGSRKFDLGGNPHGIVAVNRVVMEKPGVRMLSYFWFPQRGRVLTNAFELKIFNFWDALTRQRTDGSLVRVVTPLAAHESPSDADARLEEFVKELWPHLGEFLPGSEG